jgi:hypothetical protein
MIAPVVQDLEIFLDYEGVLRLLAMGPFQKVPVFKKLNFASQ